MVKLFVKNPEVNNVKIHFKLKDPLKRDFIQKVSNRENLNLKRHNNYYVLRSVSNKGPVYSIFLKSGFVNITGIRGFKYIRSVLDLFNKKFSQNIRIENIKVDNSSSAGRFYQVGPKSENSEYYINLEDFKLLIDSHPEFHHIRTSLTPGNFPGAIIRFKNSPTALVFSSGKFTIVGACSLEKILSTFHEICRCMKTYEKIVSHRQA